jgi:hypothetical protein
VAALPEAVDLDARAAGGRAAAHAHGLLVAGHAAGARDVVVGVELGHGARRLELEVEGRVVAGVLQAPRAQRLDRRRVEAGRADLVP